ESSVNRVFKSILAMSGMALVLGASLSAFADSTVEIVQSVPIETTLEVPGIRQTQQVWLEMINSAHSTIDIEEFYVSSKPGEALDPILSAIRAAAQRGVRVRFLIDLKFYKNYSEGPNLLGQIPNVLVKSIDFSPAVQHSKYFIVDQFNVYLGSANFDWLALSHIHEIGLHIQDPDVGQRLESVFDKDWEDAVFVQKQNPSNPRPLLSSLATSAGAGFRVVASPPSRNPTEMPDSLAGITSLLKEAKSSIKIQVYQYSTNSVHGSGSWHQLDSAIRCAAARGVKVQLLVDAVSLKGGHSELKALAGLNNIEVKSVILPEWSGGHLNYARLIHSKYFTIDGTTAWVGTENWSEGYFTSSRNVGVIFQSTEAASKLEQVFSQVWNSAYASSI
ncbi:MAG: phospholipase D-like domain-containing protein, partial [Bdellovibrionia bacterium]